MTVKLLTEHHFGVSKLKWRLQRLVRVYACQNVKLLEISCRGSNDNIRATWYEDHRCAYGKLYKIMMKSIDDFVENTATFILVSSRDQRQAGTMLMKL